MRTRMSANDRLTVPSSVIASPVVARPSNVLSPSTGLLERCGTRFLICVVPSPYVPFDCPPKVGQVNVLFAVCPARFGHDASVDAWTRTVRGVVKRIPRGRVATYGLVGVAAGPPLAARAVGNVMRAGDDLDVPCHRVVRADGRPAFPAHARRLRRDG